jgi:threonine/homoserine/homoserine lactone efflux protein
VTAVGRRDAEAPLASGADTVLPHQSLHALFAHADALSVKFPPDARPAICSAVRGVYSADTLFGAIGLGVLMRLPPQLFTLLIFAGAAYMAWIGTTLVRSSISVQSVGASESRSHWVAFRQGAITCILNPKAYLFVFSVYPQFMRPQYGSIWSQATVMGTMTVLTQLGIYGGLALAASKSRDFLVSRPGTTMFVGRAAGYLFLVIALLTAWHGWAGRSILVHR